MKRNLMALILALCLLNASFAGAEGLLPSLVDTIGKPMPSLGEVLGRYPDEEISEADGGNTEVFRSVTETDFNTFSVYLSEKGATLADYQAAGSSFSASIQVEGKTISFSYDTQVSLSNEDRILTLVTCIQHRPDLRQIVLCREVERISYEE